MIFVIISKIWYNVCNYLWISTSDTGWLSGFDPRVTTGDSSISDTGSFCPPPYIFFLGSVSRFYDGESRAISPAEIRRLRAVSRFWGGLHICTDRTTDVPATRNRVQTIDSFLRVILLEERSKDKRDDFKGVKYRSLARIWTKLCIN